MKVYITYYSFIDSYINCLLTCYVFITCHFITIEKFPLLSFIHSIYYQRTIPQNYSPTPFSTIRIRSLTLHIYNLPQQSHYTSSSIQAHTSLENPQVENRREAISLYNPAQSIVDVLTHACAQSRIPKSARVRKKMRRRTTRCAAHPTRIHRPPRRRPSENRFVTSAPAGARVRARSFSRFFI